ncbi:nitroreductase [Xanthobacter autotrophicus]|uniref:nitroreductase family protein n=1 Tax=Xanthobacter TaxID=279 RepID=UPI0024AB9DC7|nr:nitroreductase [Xanthobacter autotrophicus]MDI4665032.1 nitroreductase [Xanthobacter autotrophicus]
MIEIYAGGRPICDPWSRIARTKAMELREAIYGRRATRAFTAEPVATAVLERLVDAAIQAPSAVNEQPWDFIVIRDAALLDRMSAATRAHMLEAVESSPLPHHLRTNLEAPDFHAFHHAPALIVISVRAGGWAAEHGALAAENLMLAAHAEGLGSCWIGFAQRWLETAEGRKAIDVPEDFVPVAPVIVGHPVWPPPPVPRNPVRLRWIG